MFLGQTLKTVKYTLLVMALGLALVPPAPSCAGQTEKTPYMDELEQKANSGSGADAYKLGKLHEQKKNYEQAEHWFRIGLYHDDYLSALGLYQLNENGNRDIPQAAMYKKLGLSLLHKTAHEDARAAMTLSEAYTYGTYFPVSFEDALAWLKRAESLGSAEASYRLGMMYSDGYQVAVDPVRALYYFRRGHEAGEERATRQLAVAYATGIGVEKNLQKAKEYFIKAADAGDTLAMRDLGNYFTYHEKNQAQAVFWFTKAAEKDNADALYFLGEIYKNTDPARARAYYTQAVKQKHFYAKVALEEQQQAKKK
ncbi:MAG: tetratricopeptide repeat protein [Alphaproteobacteria bacterium]